MEKPFLNRELSQLKFDERVLEQAFDLQNPPMERLRFLSIFAANLDEFYRVRVGRLFARRADGGISDKLTSLTPAEEIDAVNTAARRLCFRRDAAYARVMSDLAEPAFRHLRFAFLTQEERSAAYRFFRQEILPRLNPIRFTQDQPLPFLENGRVCLCVRLNCAPGDAFGLLPLPDETPPFFMLPDRRHFLLPEDLLLAFGAAAFRDSPILSSTLLRVTRSTRCEKVAERPEYVREMLRKRPFLPAVRLETGANIDRDLCGRIRRDLRLPESACFHCASPLDLGFAAPLARSLRPQAEVLLCYPSRRAAYKAPAEGAAAGIIRKDRLVSTPYESIRPLTDLLWEAARDDGTREIRMTLYRVGEHSEIVSALCAAARNGRDVRIFIELRARFDEERNLRWADVLREAGCRVFFGPRAHKLHAKLLLITRGGQDHCETITGISTGNISETAARQYADLTLLTADPVIGADAKQIFTALETGSPPKGCDVLLAAPLSLKREILRLIDDEAVRAREGAQAAITAKMNGLSDREVMEHLIAAAQSGVRIRLLVRGICCLRPGIQGLTDGIEVHSIVGRFLEHARVYRFGDGGREKIYIGSADMMTRNTQRRVEILAPVFDPDIRSQIDRMLALQLGDTARAQMLRPDGSYLPPRHSGEPFDSQLFLLSQDGRPEADGHAAV